MTTCVLFDLDGTLADTAPDLHAAFNRLLATLDRPPIAFDDFRSSVSHGSRAMLKTGLGITPEDPDFQRMQRIFLDLYQERIAVHTRLFAGMERLLKELDRRTIAWGIVTNKPAYLTDPLMRGLGLQERACAIVSGDTTPYAKPHPEPILYACRQSGVSPSQTIFVGDAARDIEAGRNAGTRTLVALFGYLSDNDRPDEWQADGSIAHPLDLLAWL
ncbi:MAG: HAD-IA family hydrolase [Candidatus Thiodiazotropha sp.]